jgi:hypothetical protein
MQDCAGWGPAFGFQGQMGCVSFLDIFFDLFGWKGGNPVEKGNTESGDGEMAIPSPRLASPPLLPPHLRSRFKVLI